jgi:hypothetical protein
MRMLVVSECEHNYQNDAVSDQLTDVVEGGESKSVEEATHYTGKQTKVYYHFYIQ